MSPPGKSSDSRPAAEVMGELTLILQGVHLPCWVIDEDGMFTWVNDAFVATFGDRQGEHYSTVIAPESLDSAARHVERMHRGEPVSEFEADMMLPDGRRVRTEVSSIRLKGIGLAAAASGSPVSQPSSYRLHART